jgi:TolA-binding protein
MMSELATLLYATMGHPDSASRWYRALIAEYPDSPPIPRAMFTLAQIVREDSTSHPGSADSLYNKIIERFPHTEYANEARRLLGKPLERLAKDSAEVAYTKAEDLFLGGETTQAIEAFQTVTAQFPKSSYAPRAQYAVGWTYENVAIQPDSAITHYQALVSTYPTSPYVALVQPKLAEVQQQKAREAQAVADSGKALQAPPPVPVKAAETVQPKRATEERASPASREPGAGRRSRRQQQPVQVE